MGLARSTVRNFTLPIGYLHNGVRYREIVLSEMTGSDEDVMASEMNDEMKYATIIAARCKGFIGEGAPTAINVSQAMTLPIPDRNYIMICLRVLTAGEMYHIKVKCPKCEHQFKVHQDLTKLEVFPLTDKPMTFELRTGRKATAKIPTSYDVQWITGFMKKLGIKANPSVLTVMFIESIDVEHPGPTNTTNPEDILLVHEPISHDLKDAKKVYSFMQSLVMTERDEIRDYVKSLGGDYDKTLIITCITHPDYSGEGCGYEFTEQLSVDASFFYQRE